MLRAFGQPVQHMRQHQATMLQDVALKCCERLVRPLCKICSMDLREFIFQRSCDVTKPPFDKFCFRFSPFFFFANGNHMRQIMNNDSMVPFAKKNHSFVSFP